MHLLLARSIHTGMQSDVNLSNTEPRESAVTKDHTVSLVKKKLQRDVSHWDRREASQPTSNIGKMAHGCRADPLQCSV